MSMLDGVYILQCTNKTTGAHCTNKKKSFVRISFFSCGVIPLVYPSVSVCQS